MVRAASEVNLRTPIAGPSRKNMPIPRTAVASKAQMKTTLSVEKFESYRDAKIFLGALDEGDFG